MQLEQYRALIDSSITYGADSNAKLTELLYQVSSDIDLSSEQKLMLEYDINHMRDKLKPKIEPNGKDNSKNNGKGNHKVTRFPDYNFQLNLQRLDGVSTLNPNNLPYAIWYRDIYLPKFHPMPYPEIQYPIVTVLSLINCKAILNDYSKLPIPYFLGMQGSGKSHLANQIRNHYEPQYSVEVRPNFTGASIRDMLDERFSSGEPCLAVFDNFNVDLCVARLGVHYDLILANDKKSSISRISSKTKENEQAEYNTYCYKIFTSVIDLYSSTSTESREIARRCLILLFQASEPEESVEAYNWDGMKQEYSKLWGHTAIEQLNTVYAKALYEVNTLRPKTVPIKGSNWELCKLPIAVGVYTGIFKDIRHGIQHFQDYYDWFPTAKSSSTKDLLALSVQQYLTIEHPRLCEEDKLISVYTVPKYLPNKIAYNDIKKYVERVAGYSIRKTDQGIISQILGEYGYTLVVSGYDVHYIKED